MTYNLSATNEDFKIVTKDGGTIIIPPASISAYVATQNWVESYLTGSSGYYLKSETSSAAEISTAFSEFSRDGLPRYSLCTAQLTSVGNGLCCAIQDQTITTIGLSSSSYPISVVLPPRPIVGARDFILRIEISSVQAPSFTFSGLDETITFDSESDDWMVIEPGLNLISFTETR